MIDVLKGILGVQTVAQTFGQSVLIANVALSCDYR